MAILKIAKMGHPVLRRVADRVDDPLAPDIKSLLADMRETLADSGGIGLAAPQVHVGLQVMLYSVPALRLSPGEAPVPLTALINPVLMPLSDEMNLDWEGCLSVPGLSGQVPRYNHIRCQAVAENGSALDFEANGYHARVLQHEADHLQGILYPQRMTDMQSLTFTENAKYFADTE